MATQAERTRRTLQTKNDKYARVWAYVAMGAFLPASIAANVATAPESDLIGQIIAGVPPVSLFITSMMYERMRANWAIKTGMLISVIVSLVFSWYHIAHLAMDHGQPWYISWLLPAIVDVPMLFGGTILLTQAKLPEPVSSAPSNHSALPTTKTTTPTKTTRTRTKSTTPTKSTKTNNSEPTYPLLQTHL